MKIEIASIRGAKLTVQAGSPLLVTLDVKGETHTVNGRAEYSRALGHHIVLDRFSTAADPRTVLDIKIQISADNAKLCEKVAETYNNHIRDLAEADKAERKAWLQTPAGRSWLATKRYENPLSDD